MGLTALVLVTVFQFLVSYARMDQTIDKAQQALGVQERLQETLEALFTTVQPPRGQIPSFSTQNGQVQVLFDAGIDPDPMFSGLQRGILFCNEKKQFCFTQQPLAREEKRTAVLYENVSKLQWEFWAQSEWVTQWPKNKGSFPSMVRLRLDSLQLAFILPGQEPVVVQ